MASLLALAGPRWPEPGDRLETESIAVMFVVDVSGSMAETDINWAGQNISRLEAAKRATREFAQSRPSDLLGLVTCSSAPDDVSPLTLSHGPLLQLLEAELPRGLPDTGTNIGDSIAWALAKLRSRQGRNAVIVLVSDGEHNRPAPALTPRQAAQLCAAEGVPIYSIDCGEGAGKASLEAVAAMTGGRSFSARNAAEFQEAMASLDRLEHRPAKSFEVRRDTETFPLWATLGLGFFLVAFTLESTLWRRIP